MTKRKQQLQEAEQFWVRCEPWLKEKGYQLRARYRPGWEASWKERKIEPSSCEDGQTMEHGGFLDAERISDGAIVYFKKVPASENEVEMNRLLAQLKPEDPWNHCALCLEILQVPNEIDTDDTVLLVMPFLTRWHDPEFSTVGEALDFFQQLCEGLHFLHDNRIAHNDIKFNNVMMDSRALYDTTVHPVNPFMARDWSRKVRVSTRTKHPVKYYYIDFGLARQYQGEGPHMMDPGYGGDTTVPEFHRNEPCDPFAVDIYRLGNLVRECLMTGSLSASLFPKRRGLEFMDGLIAKMTDSDPKNRPVIQQVIAEFQELRGGLGWRKLHQPLLPVDSSSSLRRRSLHWGQQISHTLMGKPVVPTPR